jgi:hypothetical protein
MSTAIAGNGSRVQNDPLTTLPLTQGRAHIFRHAADVDPALWAATFGHSHKDFEYYRLIEETLREHFTYRYLVIEDAAGRAYTLQPLIVVDQDLAASAGGAIAEVIRRVRSLAPRFFRTRMLMAGCLVGDGDIGVVDDSDPTVAADVVAAALLAYAKSEGISLVTLKDFPVARRPQLQAFIARGYTRLDSFPSLAMDLGFESFDAYMEERLSKVTRKGLRRKLRKGSAAQPPIVMEVLEDCSEVIDEIYPLYLDVARRSEVSFEIFTRDYFLEAGVRMPGRFRYFVWRQAGKAVAFSFCTIWNDHIYDNDIGLDYAVAHELNLYYVTFRDLVEWALENGMKHYHSAPFNYDPKLHLRLKPVRHDLYVRHTSNLVNIAVQQIAPWFAPANSDPALRRYWQSAAAE